MSQVTKLKFKLSKDLKINTIPVFQTGVIYVENVFDEGTPENIIQLGKENNQRFRKEEDGIRNYERWYPSENDEDRNEDLIEVARAMMEHEDIQDASIPWTDLSWKGWRKNIPFQYELQFTRYLSGKNNRYEWHVDTVGSRLLNWIYYLNDDFEGGETEIAVEDEFIWEREERHKHNVFKKFKPTKNSLLIMPSWLIHRVKPVLNGANRQTLNGHVVH